MAKEVLFFDVKMQGSSQMIKELTAVESQLKNISKAKNKDGKETQKLKELELGLRAEKKRLSTELRKQEREFNANKNAVRAAAGSYEQLTERNKALVVQLKRVADPLGKGKKKFNELSREINGNTNKLKKMDEAMGRSHRNVGNYGGAIKDVGAKIGKFAAAIGAAFIAMRGLINIAKESIDLFDKQQLAEVSLEVALGKTSQALLDQASALQAVTRFGDESTIQGQAFLAQMGLEEDAILKLTPAILDMAQAKGMDLRSAFDLVAKSVGSSTNALSRYGVEINGVAGSSQRIDSTLKALNEKFEGQATAATAGAGKLVQLENSIGDLKETLGGIIIDGLEPFIDVAFVFVAALDRLIEGSDDYADSLDEVNKQSVKLTEEQLKAFSKLTAFQEEFNIAQKEASSQRRELTQEDIKGINERVEAREEEIKKEEKQKRTLRSLKKEVSELKTALEDVALGTKAFNTALSNLRGKEIELKKIQEALKKPKELDPYIESLKKIKEIDPFAHSAEAMEQNQLMLDEAEVKSTERTNRELAQKKQFEAAAFQAAQKGINDVFSLQKSARSRTLKADLDALRLKAETGAISQQQFEEQSLALRKQSFQKQKKADVGQALINGAVAITKTIAQLGAVGTITPMGQALIALMAGQTAAQIGIITAQKFAKGGLVEGGIFEGKSHAEGGVKFASGGRILEAEGGEAIINKRSTAMFKPMLSAMNAAGGGKKFALGGITPDAQLMTGALSEAGIGAEMARQLNKIKVINVVSDTTAQQNSITNVESEAIF